MRNTKIIGGLIINKNKKGSSLKLPPIRKIDCSISVRLCKGVTIMNYDLGNQLVTVFIQWGSGFVIYVSILALLSYLILSYLDIKTIKLISKFLYK